MKSALYWIWLQDAIGFASEKIRYVTELFGDAESFFDASEQSKRSCGYFTSLELEKIKNTNIEKARIIENECNRLGYTVIGHNSPEYPGRLREIQNPPAVLYIKGEILNLDEEPAIGMVGTRNASLHGYKTAMNLSQRLARAGALIVSGCAQGIDTAAHKGCIAAGGKTVAVLGCAIEYMYNIQNKELRETISQRGALISEYPPGTKPLRHHFPQRNRIISGISLGIVVAEAGIKSGSLITARFAAEQGRDLYALPGNADNQYMFGVNVLLRDGATPVVCALDILSNYVFDYAEKLDLRDAEVPLFVRVQEPVRIEKAEKEEKTEPKNINLNNIPQGISENAEKVYSVLTNSPVHVDIIAKRAGLNSSQTLRAITELELGDFISSMPGRQYSL